MSAHAHEWLCREIVDKATDAIIPADRDGVIRLIVRDVTARWEQERALKKRLAALEAKTPGD